MATKRPQLRRRVGSKAISAGNIVTIDIPNAHILGALEIGLNATIGVSAGGVTVVDSTLGIIPLIKRIQLKLDGSTIPLSISGTFLDYWSHVDRPGMERLALSSTADDGVWQAVLRWEVAQSEVNLVGAIKLSDYGTVQLEIEFDAVTAVATGTTVAVTGNVDIYAEMYDEASGIAFDNNVMHTLSSVFLEVAQAGDKQYDVPKGRGLLRLLMVAENNAAYTFDLVESWIWRNAQSFEPYYEQTYIQRARQRRNYGGDDMPTTGLYVMDQRRAANRDVIPLGDPVAAAYPQLIVTVSSTPPLTNAKLHIIREELENVDRVGVAA